MRISDWSSDVCSSDLRRAAFGLRRRDGGIVQAPSRHRTLGRLHGGRGVERRGEEASFQALPGNQASDGPVGQCHPVAGMQNDIAVGDLVLDIPHQRVESAELGRASCRARVCQYVYILVVAVSLKKKKK